MIIILRLYLLTIKKYAYFVDFMGGFMGGGGMKYACLSKKIKLNLTKNLFWVCWDERVGSR